jgi:hypothetical protein
MKKNIIRNTALVAIGSLALFGSIGFPYWTADTTTFTVTGSDSVVSGNKESGIISKWIVLTETETLENTDSLAYLKFNSSDIQGRLKIGQTYTAKVYGWRVPFLSMYRNIVSVE